MLVLNASFEAIHICNVKRAVKLLLGGKALEVEANGCILHAATCVVRVPEVIRLKNFVRVPYKEASFCRKNVLLRDGGVCQYCGQEYRFEDLTVDHVVPLSRGGLDAWSNVLAACKDCNRKKGNMLPDEASMLLLRRPGAPRSATFLQVARHHGRTRDVWKKYLFF